MKHTKSLFLSVIAVVALSLTLNLQAEEPGGPTTQGLYLECSFHGFFGFAMVRSNSSDPLGECSSHPNFGDAAQQHRDATTTVVNGLQKSHNPMDCLVARDPFG